LSSLNDSIGEIISHSYSDEMPDQNVDNLMKAIGNPGRFQVLIFALTSINLMIMLPTHFTSIFFAAKTEHRCSVAGGVRNLSDVIPIVVRNSERQWDGCTLFKNGSNSQRIPCDNGWTYYMEDGESTIISEVCIL
jgi:hypothetical protein